MPLINDGGSANITLPEFRPGQSGPNGLPNPNRKRNTANNNGGNHKPAPSSGLAPQGYTSPGGLAALPLTSPADTAAYYAQLQAMQYGYSTQAAAIRAQRVGVKAALQPTLADIKRSKIQGIADVQEEAIGAGLHGGTAEAEQEIAVKGEAAAARATAKTDVIAQLQQLKLQNQANAGQLQMGMANLEASRLALQAQAAASQLSQNLIMSGAEASADTFAQGNGVDVNSSSFRLAPNRQAKALSAAQAVIGAPYNSIGDFNPPGAVGGAGTAFDCSGLTKWVASKVGVELPHSAAQQAAMLPKVSAKNLQPGDLVFFSYGRLGAGAVDHVGIYSGNGQMIVSNSPGGSVQTQDVNWSAFVGGGRYIKPGKK
jgi:cell wall-associated NlpC family hydrolase